MKWIGLAALIILIILYFCLSFYDKNECLSGENDCDVNATCSNTVLSYICDCKEGFTGDGTKCTEEDNCILNERYCHADASCLSKTGGYECQCHDGFIGDGKKICVDDDECKPTSKKCHSAAKCENTAGSYKCTCKTGFSGNGTFCNDDDECELGTHDCHSNSRCVNNRGSFTCECNDGYIGNGKWCAKNSSKWSEGESGWILVITDEKTRPEAFETCSKEGARLIRLDENFKLLSELWELTSRKVNYHVDAKMINNTLVHRDGTPAKPLGIGFSHTGSNHLSIKDGCLTLFHEALSFVFAETSPFECTNITHSFICRIPKK